MKSGLSLVKGELFLPGDKSISHRAIILSALAKGESTIYNFADSDDINSTIECFKNLNCEIKKNINSLSIIGKGFKKFVPNRSTFNCGNSGTTARLLSGFLSAQNFPSKIVGDDSLSKRPMERVIEPLNTFGALLKGENGRLPINIIPSSKLKAFNYRLKIPSAQVKSALLLFGLHLEKESYIIEEKLTRNHTENLLGLKVEETEEGRKIYVSKANYPKPSIYKVPSDISTAAFFIVLALISSNSKLVIKNVLLNQTRTGIIKILKKMGGDISVKNEKKFNGEPSGDIIVKSSRLKNIEIKSDIIPNIIDEIPILSVAGLFAEGKFIIRNAEELRVKESDRISALTLNYKALGVETNEYKDGFELMGEINKKGVILKSFNDHRIAMAFKMLSLLVSYNINVDSIDSVKISNPKFLQQLKSVIL